MGSPLFIGPLGFLISALILIVLVLVVLRVVVSLAWKVIVAAAVVLGILWLLGAVSLGPLGAPPV